MRHRMRKDRVLHACDLQQRNIQPNDSRFAVRSEENTIFGWMAIIGHGHIKCAVNRLYQALNTNESPVRCRTDHGKPVRIRPWPEALSKMSPALLRRSSPVGFQDSAQDCRIFLIE